jgi:excisionase family DNA binding protein
VLDAANQTRRVTEEQERQPLDAGPANSSARARAQDQEATHVRHSESLILTTSKAEPEYLTAAQVARVLQVSSKNVYRWAERDATMPTLRIGRLVRFPRQRLLRWLLNHTVEALLPTITHEYEWCPEQGVSIAKRQTSGRRINDRALVDHRVDCLLHRLRASKCSVCPLPAK